MHADKQRRKKTFPTMFTAGARLFSRDESKPGWSSCRAACLSAPKSEKIVEHLKRDLQACS
eukprot:6513533-Prorocentrum_lima.AAC.1